MSALKITGYIAGATSVERFNKKDGNVSMKAVLYIKEASTEPPPAEMASKKRAHLLTAADEIGTLIEELTAFD